MLIENTGNLTYYEVLQRASSFLAEIGHSSFVSEWLMRERLGWDKTELVLNYKATISDEELEQFNEDLKDFFAGKPMQQIIGHEWYYNRKFKVTKDTLIPRPETEEWQDRVLKLLPKTPLKVIDIGTGTGILGLTHKLERPEDTVTLTDISDETLTVAKENAKHLEADVSFKLGNLLEPVYNEQFDVILCNPPYISENEKNVMDKSVLEHEPQMALFAEDEGLAIYKELASSLSVHLKPNAKIFLEIGYKQGPQVTEMMANHFPKAEVEIWKDFNGLDRVVVVYT